MTDAHDAPVSAAPSALTGGPAVPALQEWLSQGPLNTMLCNDLFDGDAHAFAVVLDALCERADALDDAGIDFWSWAWELVPADERSVKGEPGGDWLALLMALQYEARAAKAGEDR